MKQNTKIESANKVRYVIELIYDEPDVTNKCWNETKSIAYYGLLRKNERWRIRRMWIFFYLAEKDSTITHFSYNLKNMM